MKSPLLPGEQSGGPELTTPRSVGGELSRTSPAPLSPEQIALDSELAQRLTAAVATGVAFPPLQAGWGSTVANIR